MTGFGFVKRIALLAVLGLPVACADAPPPGDFAAADPYEQTNRFFLRGNIRLDRNILRPAAQAYDLVTPELFQHLITNGLRHLDLTKDFANYLLQGDVDRSLETFGRFTVNTIAGAGGLLDPATEFGLPKQGTNFGITLGMYGVEEGGYLVLPLLGPTTVRDAAGFVVDRAFSPSAYFGAAGVPEAVGPGLTALGFIERRDRFFDFVDEALYNSADPYVTLRAGYLQRRRAAIAGDEGAEKLLPDIFDDEAPSN